MKALIAPAARTPLSLSDTSSAVARNDRGYALQGLHENERAVVRLFGSAALAQVYALGQRCSVDQQFAVKISSIRSPERDPDGWAMLSSSIPDYLISAHTMRSFLGSALPRDLCRGIPESGVALLNLARGLQRFSNPASVELAVHDERILSLLPHEESIWSRYAPSVLTDLCACQRSAYELRLSLQPGGREILHAIKHESSDSWSAKFTRLITVTLLDSLSREDKDLLSAVRETTREYQGKQWQAFSCESFRHGVIDALQSTDGAVFSPPPEVLGLISKLHHEAWLAVRALAQDGFGPSQSARHTGQLVKGASPGLLITNLNSIAALTFMLKLGRLPAHDFQKITGATPEALHIGEYTPDAGPEFQEPVKEIEVASDLTTPPSASIANRRMECPENLKFVKETSERLADSLLAEDRQTLAPVFALLDSLPGGIREPEFLNVVKEIRKVHLARVSLTEEVTRGLLSLPATSVSGMVLGQQSAEMPSISALCSAISGVESHAAVDQIQLHSETRRKLVQRLLNENASNFEPKTDSVLLSDLKRDFSGLRALISERLINQQSEILRRQGGIFQDVYTQEFFRNHIQSGGTVLVRRKLGSEQAALDGAFIYGKAGHYPETLAELLTTITPHSDLSFAYLFVTDKDRAPGTYQMLLKGMAARLALEGCRYSLGTVAEQNHKHRDLLMSFDHRPLHATPLYLEPFGARFFAMLWELP